jgi:hypothetical protein
LYRQLDVITGIDSITSAVQTPDRNTGKAVTEMAIASTSNTLKPIYSGFVRLKVGTARVMAWAIQALTNSYNEKDIEEHPYYAALGVSNLLAILTAGNFPPVIYGFDIDARPTDAEKQQMLAAAQQGLAGGKNGVPALTYSEYSFILRYLNSGKSIKYIEMWLAKKENEKAQMEFQKQQENIKAQGEEQRNLVEVQAQAEQNKIEWEKQKEIEVASVKAEEERKTLVLKYKKEKELALLEGSLRIQERDKEKNNKKATEKNKET